MYKICITINGQMHCFAVPSLIDRSAILRPGPNNFPPLELAIAVLELVQAVPESELSQSLTQLAAGFIERVRAGLPAGVDLRFVKPA